MKPRETPPTKGLVGIAMHVLLVVFIFALVGMPESAAAMNAAVWQESSSIRLSGGSGFGWLLRGLWPVAIGIVGIAILSPLNARKLTLHLRILFGKAHEASNLAGLRLLYLPVILKTMAQIRVSSCRLRYLLVKRGVVRLRLRYLYFKRDVVHKGGWMKLFSSTNVKEHAPPLAGASAETGGEG